MTLYPNKFYSIVSTTTGATTNATSTDYLYAGSNFMATIDQKLVNGTATGTPIVRYVHPDNLGSTAVTSDTNGALAQWLDYAPFGSLLASSNTGTTTVARQYIGQYSDPSGVDYLQNRYYNSSQAQFLSEDPMFLAFGTQSQNGSQANQQNPLSNAQSVNIFRTTGVSSNSTSASGFEHNIQQWGNMWGEYLSDPQQQNAYSYGRDNPISYFDPAGLFGIFANWNAGGAAGLGEGFAGSVESGAGFTTGNNPSAPIDYGTYGTYGYLGGGPYGSATVQGISGMNNNTTLGLQAAQVLVLWSPMRHVFRS